MPTCRVFIVVLTFCCSGCLVSHTQKRIIREQEPRRQVQFESEIAAEHFNRIANNEDARKSLGSSFSFGIPFLVGLSRESAPSQNAFYNDQLARCDVNGDDFISDQEAIVFAGQ